MKTDYDTVNLVLSKSGNWMLTCRNCGTIWSKDEKSKDKGNGHKDRGNSDLLEIGYSTITSNIHHSFDPTRGLTDDEFDDDEQSDYSFDRYECSNCGDDIAHSDVSTASKEAVRENRELAKLKENMF